MIMTKKNIRLAIAYLEGQKPKNIADFEHREIEMRKLIDLLPRGRY